MGSQDREKAYTGLHAFQATQEERQTHATAIKLLGSLFLRYQPNSILDVGCGLGIYLQAAGELGVKELLGVDGPWLDAKLLKIDSRLVLIRDLENLLSLGRKFDLVMSLEVGEHLPAASAEVFVRSLTSHADVVLFSAAVPAQGGTHHVNEQWPDYWAALFAKQGFAAFDFLRPMIWNESEMFWWIKQNALVYAKVESLNNIPGLAGLAYSTQPLRMVHPDLFLSKANAAARSAREYQQLIGQLVKMRNVQVEANASGNITLSKLE